MNLIKHKPNRLSLTILHHGIRPAMLKPPYRQPDCADFNRPLMGSYPFRTDFYPVPIRPRRNKPFTVKFKHFYFSLFSLLTSKFSQYLHGVTPKPLPNGGNLLSPATSIGRGLFSLRLLKNFFLKRVSQMQPTGGH